MTKRQMKSKVSTYKVLSANKHTRTIIV